MKTCKTCQEDKENGEYYLYRRECKACVIKRNRANALSQPEKTKAYQKSYQATWGRENRRKRFCWLDDMKTDPCADCGGRFPPECMDFDHIDPSTKLFAVSQAAVSGRNVDSVKAEVAKCRLLCANCHRIRTAKQQRRRSFHTPI